MSQVRLPLTAEAFLPFCRPWQESRENTVFESYAEMMVFATGLGFQMEGPAVPQICDTFLEHPYPISLDVFKSQQYFSILLLVGLAVTKDHQVARDEKRLCGLMENFAHLGFSEMKRVLAGTTPEEFHVELAQLLVTTTSITE
jgi:hypothetical protein